MLKVWSCLGLSFVDKNSQSCLLLFLQGLWQLRCLTASGQIYDKWEAIKAFLSVAGVWKAKNHSTTKI